ncbi:pilus assembly protein [Aeromicrobium phragmitis]|uniref:Pilus assembly protein n=1 Tax=Aeromicrobium phragmitis TaxID=2478914 RepID=A0A3L8PNA8_9ACTN|nr:TadE family protein [Aeromicrobium phragmitis]RLV56875.1 pilus assembly protein [Aeromicrobium phragmitis]
MRRRGERGSMSVEVVLMFPILIAFTLLVVAGGRYVTARVDIEAAARDAARAASMERTYPAAQNAARSIAASSLSGASDCQVAELSGNFRSGGVVDVTLNCEVSNRGLELIGLSGTYRLSASGSAPIDTYRRTG